MAKGVRHAGEAGNLNANVYNSLYGYRSRQNLATELPVAFTVRRHIMCLGD